MNTPNPSTSVVLRRMSFLIIPAIGIIALSFIIPRVNPYHPPVFDLEGPVAIAAYWLTLSGDGQWAPIVSALMLLYLVSRPDITMKRRVAEFFLVFTILLVVFGGGINVNGRFAKPYFRQPRPLVVELATQPPENPALQMTVDQFYAMTEAERREHLTKILDAPDFTAIKFYPPIREHWTGMIGYGFPSGHALAAMTNSMFFLAMGFTFLSRRRMWPYYILLVWGLLVCYSRPVLREHSPAQILAGGIIGVCLAIISYLLSRLILDKCFCQASRDVRVEE